MLNNLKDNKRKRSAANKIYPTQKIASFQELSSQTWALNIKKDNRLRDY